MGIGGSFLLLAKGDRGDRAKPFENQAKFIREGDRSMMLSCLARIMAQALTSPNWVVVTRLQR